MKTIILPGYSYKNKEWAYEVKQKLNIPGEILVFEWEHWETKKSMRTKAEVERIISLVDNDEVNFIAKSVGTRILMSILPQIREHVRKVILCGIAGNPGKYSEELKSVEAKKILVIQNSQDPFMPYSEIEEEIHTIDGNIEVIEKESKEHHYPYYEDFQEFLTD